MLLSAPVVAPHPPNPWITCRREGRKDRRKPPRNGAGEKAELPLSSTQSAPDAPADKIQKYI